MQFVILKDDYCMDKYGIELNSKKPSGFKDYFLTGEYNRRSLSPSHNITHIDETEVPEDARNALKTVYSAWKKYSSADAGQSEELLSKLEKEYEDALKMLREFSCKDEISLSEFVQEFLKQLPDEVRNEIQENGYKVTTDFSDFKEALLKVSVYSISCGTLMAVVSATTSMGSSNTVTGI